MYRAEGLHRVRIPLSYRFFFCSLFVWNRATLVWINLSFLFVTWICFGAQGLFLCIFIAYTQLPMHYFMLTSYVLFHAHILRLNIHNHNHNSTIYTAIKESSLHEPFILYGWFFTQWVCFRIKPQNSMKFDNKCVSF